MKLLSVKSLNFDQLIFDDTELCILDNEVNYGIKYENIDSETDFVVQVFSENGLEQSHRLKNYKGSGDISKKLKLKRILIQFVYWCLHLLRVGGNEPLPIKLII